MFGLTRSAIIVLGVVVFCAAGLVAFSRLNIEAYPNPAPVILEITAQAAGLSAEEMEKYYTIPMEVGLYPTPGVDQYPLDLVLRPVLRPRDLQIRRRFLLRATPRRRSACSRTSICPATRSPQIQQSSLVGEIYRYQVVGPPHFGLTNLRTRAGLRRHAPSADDSRRGADQRLGRHDQAIRRRRRSAKLEAYNVTIPQLITALGNANINVGGREITIGQQSVNIRGVGLIDDGGDDDLTKGYKVQDIENVVLSQSDGVPVQVKDVARVSVGYVPRLGIAGRDHDDDVAAAIVVMGRTQHTNDVVPRIKAEVDKINSDGSLPPGSRSCPTTIAARWSTSPRTRSCTI